MEKDLEGKEIAVPWHVACCIRFVFIPKHYFCPVSTCSNVPVHTLIGIENL